MIEGYVYKILFADGCWYWGTSQYKGLPPEKDGYYGSPVTHKSKWQGLHAKIIVKLFYDEESRLDYEEKCILPDLNNPKCLNENARKAFSRAIHEKSKGVPRTQEVKQKISQKHKGKTLSSEHIQKLKSAVRPSRTLEQIKKAAEARKGYRHSQETIEKIRQSNSGRKRSVEEKAKIAESVKGFKWYNDGVENIQSRQNPGDGWVEGRLMKWETPRNKGMKWYHRDGIRRQFAEDPGEGWQQGMLRPKGKRYYNNGSEHVLAYEPPDETWVLGRLRKS